jgi:hypothetical protein
MTDSMEVSVGKMQVQVQRLEEDVSEMKGDIKAIRATLDKASGGWKMLMVIGGLSAAIGSFVTKVLTTWPLTR